MDPIRTDYGHASRNVNSIYRRGTTKGREFPKPSSSHFFADSSSNVLLGTKDRWNNECRLVLRTDSAAATLHTRFRPACPGRSDNWTATMNRTQTHRSPPSGLPRRKQRPRRLRTGDESVRRLGAKQGRGETGGERGPQTGGHPLIGEADQSRARFRVPKGLLERRGQKDEGRKIVHFRPTIFFCPPPFFLPLRTWPQICRPESAPNWKHQEEITTD